MTVPALQTWAFRLASGLAGVGLFAFALHPAGSSLGYLGSGLLMLSLLAVLLFGWRVLGEDAVLASLALLLGYLVFSTVAAYVRFGDSYLAQILESSRGHMEILLVAVAMGWWLRRWPRALYPVLILAAAGLMVRILIHVDWDDPLQFLARAHRPGFGMSVIHFALSAALGVVGVMVFARRILGVGRSLAAQLPLGVVAGGFLGVFAYALGLTQTRMAWLAVAAAAPFVLLYILVNRTQPFAATAYRAGLGLLLCVLVGGGLFLTWDAMEKRVFDRLDELAAAMRLDGAQLGDVGIGARYHKLATGLEVFEERPLTGWGMGASAPLYAGEAGVRMETDDVHNLYVQVLVELGLVGAALGALFVVLLGRSVWRAYRAGLFPSDLVMWIAVSALVVAVWAMGNGKLWQAKVRNPFAFVLGIALAVHFVRQEAARLHLRRGAGPEGRDDPSA